jgi:hypothetical protein
MKDRLEEYVRSHREEFDVFEPGESLWEGIEKKIESGKKIHLGFYLIRAAGIAAIFLISLTIHRFFFRTSDQALEIPELVEAEIYYSGLIDNKLEEVRPLLSEYPEIESEIDTDLSELDSVYKSLKEDLKDNVSNQEVVEAMLDNYRMRIEILEEMLQYLESKNDDKTSNYSEYEL